MPAKGSRGPWLWPLVLTIAGVVLLLNNFFLLGTFDATRLWPLALVAVGAVILIRGDLLPSADNRTFGITRGSVESATLEISSGEIDVQIRALQQQGRLIAGQYALSSRPVMRVSETHTHLKMDRSATPWIAFADWEMGLAHDLPWQILISTSLGQINLNLADIIVQEAVLASGIGDIRVVCPAESLGPIHMSSNLGNIHIINPTDSPVRITVQSSQFFRVHADDRRYVESEPGVYTSLNAQESPSPVEIFISGSFGDAYLT